MQTHAFSQALLHKFTDIQTLATFPILALAYIPPACMNVYACVSV